MKHFKNLKKFLIKNLTENKMKCKNYMQNIHGGPQCKKKDRKTPR